MPEKPQGPSDPDDPLSSLPPIQEDPKRRPTGAESTPGGVAAPLGTETFETQALPALDALLQTDFMEVLPSVKGLKGLQPHAESHEPMGDDYIMALGEVMFLDHYIREYTKAGMADAVGDTILFSLSVSNAKLEFGWGKAKRMGARTFKESTGFPDAGLWDPVFMGISKSHTGTPAVQPDMDNSNVSNLYLRAHDITEVRRLEFEDTDAAAGNDICLQQRGDAAGAILEIVNNNDATQYSSPTYRRLRLADPVGADDATTKRYVDALSYAGHTLLDASLHTDTLAAGVTDGSIVIGNVTPKWSELVISIPAANVRNVLGVDNGELRPSWKTALDVTNPVNAGGAASPGTSLVFSHRDHVHAVAASHSGSAHHAAVTIHADAAHALSTQELQAVLAASGQTGHMSGAMYDALVANTAKLAGIEATADVTDAANVAGAGAVMDSDISPGEGFLRKTGAGAYTAHKSNLAAAAAPVAADDDADAGYSVGSVWVDTTNDNMYVCVDSTNDAAVWLHLNAPAAAHDHTGAADGGVLTDDKHDGFSDYEEISTIPAAGALKHGRLFTATLDDNDSLSPGGGVTGMYYRRNDGLMVKLSDDFPYSQKTRYVDQDDEPAFLNSWVNFETGHRQVHFLKDFLGCVWVTGLIKTGTITLDVFSLPEGFWDTGGWIRWATMSNAALGILDLESGINVQATAGNNAYFSLARLAFPETNRITWHLVGGGGEPAYENNWVDNGGGWSPPAFAKDAIGRVWIKGVVKDGNPATVFTLPAGYRPPANINLPIITDNNVIGHLAVTAAGAVNVNLLGAGTNAWATIACVFIADGEVTWHEVGSGGGEPAFENAWVNAGGIYNTAAFVKDAAGIVHIKGLVDTGTIGQTVFTLPVGYRPRSKELFGTLSNNAIARLDVAADGSVKAVAGNNAWFSLHCAFVAEQ